MTKNIKLLSVSGRKRSGKNTVADIITKIMKEKGQEYQSVAFAGKLKKISSILTGVPEDGWETEEDKDKLLGKEWFTFNEYGLKVDMTRRRFLQLLGSEACNQRLHPNTWINALSMEHRPDSNWIVTDVRFPQEVKAIEERNGVTIRVIRPSRDNHGDAHISETALDNYNGYDFKIVNEGTLEDLEEKVRAVLFQLKMI